VSGIWSRLKQVSLVG